jgi:hypothetical protein
VSGRHRIPVIHAPLNGSDRSTPETGNRQAPVRHAAVGFPFRFRPGRGDPLDQRHYSGAHHLGGAQMLAGESEQQRRRVVFHRPRQQELVQLMPTADTCAGVTP